MVVDLGCGAGRWARALSESGYDVLGIDVSAPMLSLARRRAPAARFLRASLHRAELPPCDAVTALGEAIVYGASAQDLRRLFARAFAALRPGGVFVFDVREKMPGEPPGVRLSGYEGKDWALVVRYDRSARRLVRRITVFRKIGASFRRSAGSHWVGLFTRAEILRELERSGFKARALSGYGRRPTADGVTAFLARKPGRSMNHSSPRPAR